MPTEVLTIVISAVAVMLSFFTCFGWLIQRFDRALQQSAHRMEQRIDRVEHELGQRIDRVERELVEVKVAVARIEGPQRRLLTAH